MKEKKQNTLQVQWNRLRREKNKIITKLIYFFRISFDEDIDPW